MAIIDIKRTVSLDGAIMPVALEGTLYGGENQAHRFIINATKDGAALNLSGAVTASFLRKADDAEVPLTGEIIGGGAAVTLAQSCYTQPGRFELTIFLTQNGSKTALYSCNGNVRNTSASEIVDPGHVVPDITDIIAEYARMQAASDAAEAAAESAAEAATQNVHDAYANTDLNVTGRGYQTLRAVNFADNVIEGKYMRVVSSSDAAHATEDTASGWSIHEYQFGQRMVFRVEALSKNTAIGGDPSIMAARRTTTYPAEDGGQTVTEYFSIDLDRVGATFIADAIRVNYNPSLGYSFNDISISYSENRNFEDIVVIGNHLSEADSIVAFGDSIFAGYNASNRGVITQLGELLNLPVTNLAVSNATLSNAAPRPSTDAGSVVDQVAAYISDQANRGKKPLYLINGGTNDQYHHRLTDLGTYTDGVNGIYDTIYGATYKIINDLLGFGAQPWQIVVTTPIPKDIRNSTAEHVAEIDAQLTAIGAAMYDIGAAMMVNVINGYGGVFDNLTDANAMQLLMPDNTHPSQYGAKLYAERIFRLLGTAMQPEVAALKSAFTDTELSTFASPISYSRITTSSMWTSGQGVGENTGANFNNTKYCRSGYIKYATPTILYINSADYEFNCWAYSSDSASAATFSPKKEYDSNPVIISPKNSSTYFRIGVRRKDGVYMSASDITALTTAVKTFTLTDSTLTLAGVPADAKAVSDKAMLFKGALADNTDLNSIITTGIYYLESSYSYQHAPATSGFLIVLRQDSVVEQLFVRFRNIHGVLIDKFTLYKRDGNSSEVTSSWVNTDRVFSRTIAFFGDSITWGRDGNSSSGARSDYQIPDIVANALGVTTVNYGVGGQGYMPHGSVPSAYDNISSQDLSGVNTVVMCYGVNDGYVALGDWDSTDEDTVMGQFNKIINYIYTEYPGMQVIVFAPFNGTNVGTYPDYWYGPRNHQNGYPSRKIMSDTLKQACDYYWIPYIEQYDSPLNAKTITNYLPDGVHPSDAGYKLIGEWFAAKLRGLM